MNDMTPVALAKVIRTSDGQSVELPEGFRFEGSEVRISREGDQIVLEPVDDRPIDDDAIDEATGLTIRELDALVQEALDSGPDEPWDVEEVKPYCRGER